MATIDKQKRVMQILWTKKYQDNLVSLHNVRLAIYETIGCDKRTVSACIKVLKELGWLKRMSKERFRIMSNEYLANDNF